MGLYFRGGDYHMFYNEIDLYLSKNSIKKVKQHIFNMFTCQNFSNYNHLSQSWHQIMSSCYLAVACRVMKTKMF